MVYGKCRKDFYKIFIMISEKYLKDKTIIVTGALGKLGQNLCKNLHNSNASVIAIARLKNKKKELVKKISSFCDLYDCDVSNEEEFKEIIVQIKSKYKEINGLVTTTSFRPMKLGIDDSIENWIDSVSKNSAAIFIPCRCVGKIMCKQKLGSIVNVSSIYGLGAPLPNLYKGTDLKTEPDYPFIKGGTIALTKYLASFFGEYNVRVNVITPGGIFNNQPEIFLGNYSKRVPLQRMAFEDEVSNTISFLLSDQSTYITGATIPIDGGWSAT